MSISRKSLQSDNKKNTDEEDSNSGVSEYPKIPSSS